MPFGPIYSVGPFSIVRVFEYLSMLDLADVFSDVIAGGLGALVGAYAAFQLERVSRKDEQRQFRIESGYRALATLGEFRDACRYVQKEIIEPVRNAGPEAWWYMQPLSVFPPPAARLDFSSLSFLMCTGNTDDADALAGALAAERAYINWHKMMQLWHDEKAESRRLLSPRSRKDKNWSDEELLEILGFYLKSSLEKAVDWMPKTTQSIVDRSREALADLYRSLGRNFPDYSFNFPHEGEIQSA